MLNTDTLMGVPTSPCESYLSSPHPAEGLVNHINAIHTASFLSYLLDQKI